MIIKSIYVNRDTSPFQTWGSVNFQDKASIFVTIINDINGPKVQADTSNSLCSTLTQASWFDNLFSTVDPTSVVITHCIIDLAPVVSTFTFFLNINNVPKGYMNSEFLNLFNIFYKERASCRKILLSRCNNNTITTMG